MEYMDGEFPLFYVRYRLEDDNKCDFVLITGFDGSCTQDLLFAGVYDLLMHINIKKFDNKNATINKIMEMLMIEGQFTLPEETRQ